jgi:biopolymer transport protein ExbD/biopolymer transport protein TolR
MAEINVTPLVDVMLVLLIVFMVAAPLMAVGVPVDLPKVQAKQLNEQKPPIAVSVDAEGRFFIDQKEVASEDLIGELSTNADNDKERRIHVRGDRNVAYGKVIEAMGKINSAGFTKVALVSEAPGQASPRAVAQ